MGNLKDVLRARREEVLERWFRKVEPRPAARMLPRELVMNNVPRLLEELIGALESPDPFLAVTRIPSGAADEHGRSRADLHYGLSELGEEYNSLREALLETLDEAGVRVDNSGARALHAAVDAAHRRGVETFIRIEQARLRERQSAFLAQVAHDFRAPLASLSTNLQLMLRTARRDEAARLRRMQNALRRLLLLVEGQLATEAALAGELTARPSDVDLTLLVNDIANLLRSRVEAKGLALAVHVPDGLALVTDPLLLSQVLQNLLDNSVKYTERGSVTVSARSDGDEVILDVEDTGRGIPAESVPLIFTLYHRDEHATPGRGVGLAVVRQVLEKLHGSITVWTEEHRGSRFEVRLPFTMEVKEPLPRDAAADALHP